MGFTSFFLAQAPPPRRLRGFPLPLWRGVNGIANNELITVSQTIVEQGLRALFSNKKQGYLLPSPTGRGWGVGLIVEQGLRALFSNKKQGYSLPSPTGRGWGWGCWSPCPVLQGGDGGGASVYLCNIASVF